MFLLSRRNALNMLKLLAMDKTRYNSEQVEFVKGNQQDLKAGLVEQATHLIRDPNLEFQTSLTKESLVLVTPAINSIKQNLLFQSILTQIKRLKKVNRSHSCLKEKS